MPPGEMPAGQAYAMLMATGRYTDPMLGRLRSPSRDAEELARVLRDPAVGGFDAATLVDKPGHVLREEIEGFFADRQLDDLLVFYASCHGVKDPSGRLYFASSTTKLSRLASTGISAEFLFEQVDRCRARKILVLLDCCFSGSYAKGHLPRAGERVEIGLREGRGRAAISSSTEEEYSFEVGTGKVTGAAAPSVFTGALVKGLGTGAADLDGDGLISVDDLYGYVKEQVREATPYQTPEKKWGEVRGDFFIARNPNPPKASPDPLPAELIDALDSPYVSIRQGVVQELAALARGEKKGIAATALEALRKLQDDDSRLVSAAARAALPAVQESPQLLAPQSPPAPARRRTRHDTPPGGYPAVPLETPEPRHGGDVTTRRRLRLAGIMAVTSAVLGVAGLFPHYISGETPGEGSFQVHFSISQVAYAWPSFVIGSAVLALAAGAYLLIARDGNLAGQGLLLAAAAAAITALVFNASHYSRYFTRDSVWHDSAQSYGLGYWLQLAASVSLIAAVWLAARSLAGAGQVRAGRRPARTVVTRVTTLLGVAGALALAVQDVQLWTGPVPEVKLVAISSSLATIWAFLLPYWMTALPHRLGAALLAGWIWLGGVFCCYFFQFLSADSQRGNRIPVSVFALTLLALATHAIRLARAERGAAAAAGRGTA